MDLSICQNSLNWPRTTLKWILYLSLILLELESYIRTERSQRYHLWFSLCVKKYGGHTSMWPQGGQMMCLMPASDLRNWEARCPSLRHVRGSDAMCLVWAVDTLAVLGSVDSNPESGRPSVLRLPRPGLLYTLVLALDRKETWRTLAMVLRKSRTRNCALKLWSLFSKVKPHLFIHCFVLTCPLDISIELAKKFVWVFLLGGMENLNELFDQTSTFYSVWFLFIFFFSFNFLFIYFSFIFISWRLITLQYCSGFCHTLTWISHGFTCIPHPDHPSHLPLYPIPLGLPSAPGPSTCLMCVIFNLDQLSFTPSVVLCPQL